MNVLTINEIAVRQDAKGRYCLNDLHRASGGDTKHQPSFWMRNAQTRALIEEIGNSAILQSSETAGIPVVTLEGAGGGTYVVKELVYAYAMWISAAFHLKVIRTFDAAVAGPQAQPANLSRMEILKLAMDAEQARIDAEAKLALAAPKVVYADAMLNATGTVLVRDAAKTIGVPVRKLEKALREKGVILPGNGPAAKYVAQGYLVESLGYYDTDTRGRQISRTTRVTGKGLEFLRRFAQRHADILAATPKKAAA